MWNLVEGLGGEKTDSLCYSWLKESAVNRGISTAMRR
jgi:hypothetical protein